MRRITFFLIAIICFSCNNDDSKEAIDSIVGTWYLSKVFIDDVEQALSSCDKLDQITAFENGFYYALNFDDETGECIAFVSNDAVQVMPSNYSIVLTDYPNAIWENQSNGNYTLLLEETAPVINIIFESYDSFYFLEQDEDSIRKNMYVREGLN